MGSAGRSAHIRTAIPSLRNRHHVPHALPTCALPHVVSTPKAFSIPYTAMSDSKENPKKRVDELEGFLYTIMGSTHPEYGRTYDCPEFALHHIHAQCRVKAGDAKSVPQALGDMEKNEDVQPTRAELEERVEELEAALRLAYGAADNFRADMTDEAFQELEEVFLNALDE